MASNVRTSAGSKLFVGNPVAALNTPGGYTLTNLKTAGFVEVGELVDLGSFGKKFNLVTFNPLGDRGTVKRKGSYNNGTLALKMGSNVTDVGQTKLRDASVSDSSYVFKVQTQSGSTYYFTGQVMGFSLEIGSVDQITSATADVEIDNDIMPDVQNV